MAEYPIKISKFLIGNEREHRLMIDRDLQKLYQLEQDQKKINDLFQDVYSYATTSTGFYVSSSTGNDENSGLTTASQLATIQAAVDKIPFNLNNNFYVIVLADDVFEETVTILERANGQVQFSGSGSTTWKNNSLKEYNLRVLDVGANINGINFQNNFTSENWAIQSWSDKSVIIEGCTFSGNGTHSGVLFNAGGLVDLLNCYDGATPCNFKIINSPASITFDHENFISASNYDSIVIKGRAGDILLNSSSNLFHEVYETNSNYTIKNSDQVVLGDAVGGDITFYLPSANNAQGKVYNIHKNDASANKVIIDPSGTETIDGNATNDLVLENQAVSVVSDGTEWWTLSKESITNFNINSATITNFISENASITNLAIGAIYPSNITINSLSCTTITCGDIDTVNLNATGDTNLALTTITNLSSDNITSTNLGITGNTNLGLTTLTNLNANNITTGNLGVTGELHAIDLTATNLSVSGNTNLGDLTASAIACISVESSSAALGQLTATNFTTYNISATNLGVSGAANIANLTTTTLVATNASITNLAIAALYPSNVTLNSFSCTTINCGDLTTTNLGVSGNTHLRDTTANNANLTTLNATNITATGLGVTGNTNLGLTTVTNLNATNISATNIGATGEVNGATGVFTSLTATNLNVSGNTNVANITCTNINLEGGQIRFPASASASSEVNTLDDYEEGYYTATLTCGTSGTITLASNFDTLAYTKIGRLVTIQGGLGTTSISSPVGDLRLNLPFAMTGLTKFAERTTGSVMPAGIIAIGSAGALGILALSGSSVSIVERTTTSVLLDVANHIDADCNLYISFRYISE